MVHQYSVLVELVVQALKVLLLVVVMELAVVVAHIVVITHGEGHLVVLAFAIYGFKEI